MQKTGKTLHRLETKMKKPGVIPSSISILYLKQHAADVVAGGSGNGGEAAWLVCHV